MKLGANVKNLKIGDKVVADVGDTCGKCFYCVRGVTLFCEHFRARGVSMDGGFADYVVCDAAHAFPCA